MRPFVKTVVITFVVIYMTSLSWALVSAHQDWEQTASSTRSVQQEVVYNNDGKVYAIGNVGEYGCQAGITLTNAPMRCSIESIHHKYTMVERLRSAGSFVKWHLFVMISLLVVTFCTIEASRQKKTTTPSRKESTLDREPLG